VQFSDDPTLEALIGKVCLVFARVEQEAGHAVMAAHGNWGVAMSTDYLDYSANSGRLLDWLKSIAKAYPEARSDASALVCDLRALKNQRDQWAHSAAVIDLWLMMREKGLTSMTDRDVDRGRLLNGKQAGHINAPTQTDVEAYIAWASDVGDAAMALARKLDGLAESGIRPVDVPR
jgi:hypothetical protein